ncbi:phosphotransferase family protein [Streptomyces daliensis]|uniref:Aminoglycoside phosphotransferase n=1 Tax=Streptomyces daliensis TaxID=299421 RepID=A0A8T4INR2_9ACTN|nr:aminoglycoside phosphotransferase [Streptomyces daliensis]
MRETAARHLPGDGTYTAVDALGGGASAVAAVLSTGTSTVFVKGMPHGHHDEAEADGLDLEYEVNAQLPGCCPRVLWRVTVAGWTLLGFEAVEGGEHAEFAPGSPDLEPIVQALTTISGIPAPSLPLLSAWERWGYYCSEADAPLLHGDSLLHTDLAATNILISQDGRAHVIDWSWAAQGASWIDPALWAIRLISDGGHTPAEAAHWARKVPAFRAAAPGAVAVLSQAEAARWADLYADGTPGIEGVTRASRLWAEHWGTRSA